MKDMVIEFVWVLCSLFIVLGLIAFMLVHTYILRPFQKLEHFAGEIARGNLEIPLMNERRNLFGSFTWAFDMMRNELRSAREREAEADRTKKEMVAALSHDLRTPIASIKAYAECLKSLPEKNSERSERYIDVILQKTDEIAKLSQDMFLHAISDLEKLEINPCEYESRELINNIIEPLILHYENRIIITNPIPDMIVYTDKLRLGQVFENILSNAAKYAPNSLVEISTIIEENMLKCRIKDYGGGIAPEDIPFIFDKFYRGKNAKESGAPGSGIGLYISKYILEKTGGQIKASNYREDGQKGLIVEVSIRMI